LISGSQSIHISDPEKKQDEDFDPSFDLVRCQPSPFKDKAI